LLQRHGTRHKVHILAIAELLRLLALVLLGPLLCLMVLLNPSLLHCHLVLALTLVQLRLLLSLCLLQLLLKQIVISNATCSSTLGPQSILPVRIQVLGVARGGLEGIASLHGAMILDHPTNLCPS
jgi:hypothetical protein